VREIQEADSTQQKALLIYMVLTTHTRTDTISHGTEPRTDTTSKIVAFQSDVPFPSAVPRPICRPAEAFQNQAPQSSKQTQTFQTPKSSLQVYERRDPTLPKAVT